MKINLTPSQDDNEEECAMYSKSDNIEIMINDEAGGLIKKNLNHSKINIKVI